MKHTLKRGANRVATLAATRPNEVKWSSGGAAIGGGSGLLIGGIGIAAMGGAGGISALFLAIILAVICGIVRSRIGVEMDRRS